MKTVSRLALVLPLSVLLAGCASTSYGEDEASAYGAFLAARYAGVNRDAEGAAAYYAQAHELAPDDATLADRAYITALLSGDMRNAVEYGQASVAAGDPSRLAGLYLAADALAQRRYTETRAILDNAPAQGPFNDFLADIMTHWSILGGGNPVAALEAAQDMTAPAYLAAFMSLHRAMLADAAGERETADGSYQAAVLASPFQRMTTELYGGFLERQDRTADALAIYAAYLGRDPEDASILAAYERADSGGRAPRILTPAEGAARAMFGPSATLAAQAEMDLAVLYLRMVERLDPDYAPIHLLLGETLQRINLPDVALVEYARVPPGPFRLAAQVDLIWLTARLDNIEAATGLARQLVIESDDDEARLILADLLRVSGGCDEAEQLYGTVITNHRSRGDWVDWRYHYFRASCLIYLDRWGEAETEYLAALERGSDEPQVLNDLGYLWIDRGERLDEAFEMVARAAELEPESGHIIDSLGWAHFRLGNYELAVQELERAAELEPGNPTANFHLGDAYWRVGRHLEAGFQWRRALDLDPSEDERTALLDRLENGLVSSDLGGEAELANNLSETE